MAVKFDGGEALEPLLLGQPLSKGVAIAMINMQYNFFTVEFLKTHCHIQSGPEKPA